NLRPCYLCRQPNQSSHQQKIAENSNWVTLYQGLPYQDYVKILSKCKYGIHFKQEPFGISIAEMVKAGCIPFVKSKGGQVEIVGSENEALFFKKPQEAVEKIVAVLSQPAQTAQLRQSLAKQKHLFSTDRFMAEIDREVEAYFAQH
ncbi:MAG: glycosyltransferase, partial [Prochlorotrichaceae cyanobacterium]